MAITNIITHVDSSRACEQRFRAALKLAQTHHAELSTLYTIPAYSIPVYAEARIGSDILEQAKVAMWDTAKEVQAKYESISREAGQSIQCFITEGAPASILSQYARYTDLLVLGQGEPEDPEDTSTGLADHVVLECGTPCLVIPYIGPQQTLGKRILVSWNAGRECARAVKDAIPLLQQADHVELISINPLRGDIDEGSVPGLDICRYLAQHEVEAKTVRVDSDEIDTGDILLSHVTDLAADLIVMGAYGHSRLREVVLGGVTRHVMKHMTVPVFISH